MSPVARGSGLSDFHEVRDLINQVGDSDDHRFTMIESECQIVNRFSEGRNYYRFAIVVDCQEAKADDPLAMRSGGFGGQGDGNEFPLFNGVDIEEEKSL